jgi:hypothetical protein
VYLPFRVIFHESLHDHVASLHPTRFTKQRLYQIRKEIQISESSPTEPSAAAASPAENASGQLLYVLPLPRNSANELSNSPVLR